jgi:hypothetical protein
MTLIVIAYVVAAAALFWVGMVTFFLGGLIFVILAVVLAGLKLAGIFVWSWWWAALPLFGAVGGAVVKMRIAARDPNF